MTIISSLKWLLSLQSTISFHTLTFLSSTSDAYLLIVYVAEQDIKLNIFLYMILLKIFLIYLKLTIMAVLWLMKP